MREIPILFSTPMVQAILDDRKSATRRVVKPQPVMDESGMWHWKDCQWMNGGIGFPASGIKDYARYQPNDVLWVRETWSVFSPTYGTAPQIIYMADDYTPAVMRAVDKGEIKWRPSIHMPRAAARLFLRVMDVRMEQVQDINAEDAVAEGAVKRPHYMKYGGEKCLAVHKRYIDEFKDLWNIINAKRGYGWDVNPWVWAVEFKRITEEQ